MKLNITEYKTLVFDCDGVVLNSNKIKTEAFYKSVLRFGEIAANKMVEYHTENGGVSRYKKFAYFLENIAPRHGNQKTATTLENLLSSYAHFVKSGLLSCEVAPGLKKLRELTSKTRWMIVSGGDQTELREIFLRRDLFIFFDGGIFGSPDTKEVILKRELNCGNISHPALFLGDSRYDYEAARSADLQFAFLSGWTEMSQWEKWVSENDLSSFNSIKCMLSKLLD